MCRFSGTSSSSTTQKRPFWKATNGCEQRYGTADRTFPAHNQAHVQGSELRFGSGLNPHMKGIVRGGLLIGRKQCRRR